MNNVDAMSYLLRNLQWLLKFSKEGLLLKSLALWLFEILLDLKI